MKREEQIRQAAKDRADQYSHPVEWNDCYRHFSQGAKWADKTMIDKACMWLSLNMTDIVYLGVNGNLYKPEFIQNFKQAMEE